MKHYGTISSARILVKNTSGVDVVKEEKESMKCLRNATRGKYTEYSDVLQRASEQYPLEDLGDSVHLLIEDDMDNMDDTVNLVDHMEDTDGVYALNHEYEQHCHVQFKQPPDRRAERTLIIVSILTILFMTGEFIGGYLSGSLAVMTDAGHLMSDLFSFLISLVAIYISRWPATKRMSFGFHRAEVLGAMVSILIIWAITAILVYLAIMRLISDDYDVEGMTMAITAAAAVVFNIVMGLVLHFGGASHAHSHGGARHSHSHSNNNHSHNTNNHSHNNDHNHDLHQRNTPSPTLPTTTNVPNGTTTTRHPPVPSPESLSPDMPRNLRDTMSVNLSSYPGEETLHTHRQRNINVRAAFVHVVGDLLQSVGVLIAALVVWWRPDLKMVDPICTFMFSVLVMFTTVTVLRDGLSVLMEATPSDVDYNAVKADLLKIDGVVQVHSLHLWSLTMDKAALAVHLAIDDTADALRVMSVANDKMRKEYNLAFTTVQVEPFVDQVMQACVDCVGPQR